LAVLLAGFLVLAPLAGAGAQEGVSEPSVPELLVPGDPAVTTVPAVTEGAELDAGAPASTSVPAATDAPSGDDGLAASTKVWIIIGGLVGVALLVLLLTILYWRRTKPSAVAARKAAKAGAGPGAGPAADDSEGDESVAGPVATEPVTSSEPVAPVPEQESQPKDPTSAPKGDGPAPEPPRPVGDEPPPDPRRSVFAPPPPSDKPPSE
jgi:hypothetical protein